MLEKYIPVKATKTGGHKTTHIKIRLYYTLGGYNYFTYKREPRGYYLTVSPVEREEIRPGCWMEGFIAFSGYKHLVKEVTRQSKKAEAEAEQESAKLAPAMIERVCREYGLEIIEEPAAENEKEAC